jgi:hypothetical protein
VVRLLSAAQFIWPSALKSPKNTFSFERLCLMRRTPVPTSWVVYRATFDRKAEAMTAVCAQEEWIGIEQSQPGRCTLLKSGIATEGEAEQFARAERAAQAATIPRQP